MLYVDNDVILKFCALDLMAELLAHLDARFDEVRVLDTAYNKIKKSSTRAKTKKEFHDRYGAAGIERALAFVRGAQQARGYDPALFDRLVAVPKIDIGEAALVAIACADPNSLLLSGDKRFIAALNAAECADIIERLKGRVLSFEELLLAVYDRLGFNDCNKRVFAAMKDASIDGFLKLAIRDDEQHVRAAFESAIRETRARCPGLFPAVDEAAPDDEPIGDDESSPDTEEP